MDTIDQKRGKIFVQSSKGRKDRVVYLSSDALQALTDYLKVCPASSPRHILPAGKGTHGGKPISVRGIQKRIRVLWKQDRDDGILPSPPLCKLERFNFINFVYKQKQY